MSQGQGQGRGGAPVPTNMGSGGQGSTGLNSQAPTNPRRMGPERADQQGVTQSNDNARLRTGTTGGGQVTEDSGRRANRQGPANASDRGVERSNENAGLRDSNTGGGNQGGGNQGGGSQGGGNQGGSQGGSNLNQLLRDGLRITDPTGALVGTVTGVTRGADGDITGVTLRLPDGSTRTVDADDIRITDGTATLNLSQVGSPPAGAEALAARLQRGAEVFDPSGQLLGRIERLVTSGQGGNVRSVVVQVRNGARRFLRTVPIESVTLSPTGQIVVNVGGTGG